MTQNPALQKVFNVMGAERGRVIIDQTLKQLGMSVDANYGLKDQVKAELDYARQIFAQHPQWPVIDVTGRAIEETAVIILESLKERDETKQIARQIV